MQTSLAREAAASVCRAIRSQEISIARIQRTRSLAASTTTAYRPFSSSRRRCVVSDNGTTASHRIAQSPASSSAPSPATAFASSEAAPNALTPDPSDVPLRSLTEGLDDPPPVLAENEKQVDWTRSFHGLSAAPFSAEASAILTQDIKFDDIEIKPDGIIYLPEIKYRRILNRAFGPGGWGLAPRGETIVTGKVVTREYGLVASGRLVSIARGEQTYFDPDGIPTATEGCKSNALMRCCKDLGVASELWDPRFIKRFMAEMGREMLVEHVVTKKRRKHWMRKEDELRYPFVEVQSQQQAQGQPRQSFVRRAASTSGGSAAAAQ